MDQLKALRYFVSVVRARSFTAASRQLGVSRSYLSREIAALEESLGVRLINRTTRQVSPTEPGRVYFERCWKILEEIDDAGFELTSSNSGPRGRLTLLAPKSLAVFSLPSIIGEFGKLYPEVEIAVVVRDQNLDLVQNGIDLALRFGELQDSTLLCRRLTSASLRLCASPKYLEMRGAPVTPQDLTKHNCLRHVVFASGSVWRFTNSAGQINVNISGNLMGNSSVFLRECVLMDLGIGILPDYSIAADIESGRIVSLLDDYSIGALSLYGVYFGEKMPHRVRLFMDHMVSWYAAVDRRERERG